MLAAQTSFLINADIYRTEFHTRLMQALVALKCRFSNLDKNSLTKKINLVIEKLVRIETQSKANEDIDHPMLKRILDSSASSRIKDGWLNVIRGIYLKFKSHACYLVLLQSILEELKEVIPDVKSLQISDANTLADIVREIELVIIRTTTANEHKQRIETESVRLRQLHTTRNYGSERPNVENDLRELALALETTNFFSVPLRDNISGVDKGIHLAKAAIAPPTAVSIAPVAERVIAPFATEDGKRILAAKNLELTYNKIIDEQRLSLGIHATAHRFRLQRKQQSNQTINVFKTVLTRGDTDVPEEETLYLVYAHGNMESASASICSLTQRAQVIMHKDPTIRRIVCCVPDYPASAASGGLYKDLEEMGIDSIGVVVEHIVKTSRISGNIKIIGYSLGGIISACAADYLHKQGHTFSYHSINSLARPDKFVGNGPAAAVLGEAVAYHYNFDAIGPIERFRAAGLNVTVAANFDDQVLPIPVSVVAHLPCNKEIFTAAVLLRFQQLFPQGMTADLKALHQDLVAALQKANSPCTIHLDGGHGDVERALVAAISHSLQDHKQTLLRKADMQVCDALKKHFNLYSENMFSNGRKPANIAFFQAYNQLSQYCDHLYKNGNIGPTEKSKLILGFLHHSLKVNKTYTGRLKEYIQRALEDQKFGFLQTTVEYAGQCQAHYLQFVVQHTVHMANFMPEQPASPPQPAQSPVSSRSFGLSSVSDA